MDIPVPPVFNASLENEQQSKSTKVHHPNTNGDSKVEAFLWVLKRRDLKHCLRKHFKETPSVSCDFKKTTLPLRD